ncbi:MAG: class I SAM-dependent methyltransferase [Acidilobaceae archaeon]
MTELPRFLLIRERYEIACESYDELYKEEQAEKYFVALKLVKPWGIVLDAGCGTALLAEYFDFTGTLKNVSLYICLDYSSCMLKRARERLESLDMRYVLLEASIEEIPLPSKSVDVTYSITVLNLLDNPLEGLKELKRVTRSKLVATVLREAKVNDALFEEGCTLEEATSKDDVFFCPV